jgi:hypothetical protein
MYWVQVGGGGGGGGAATPAVQLNSIFSAKTDPRENPEKTPVDHRNFDSINLRAGSKATNTKYSMIFGTL